MPENKGFYQKYIVERVDGKPVGRTFTLEIDKDPFAKPALQAYRDAAAAAAGYDDLVVALDEILTQ
jgi:hypothetical protein